MRQRAYTYVIIYSWGEGKTPTKLLEANKMKSGKQCFIKIRKWAQEVGATITESKYFDLITIEYKGLKFVAEQRESTSLRVVNRGRGTKWAGNPAGFYFGHSIPNDPRSTYTYQSTQTSAIMEMEYQAKRKEASK
jgi:hypothetical protein